MTNELKVVSLKKNKNNYVVLLSDGTEIEANEDLILKYRLVEKHILDEDDLNKIKDDSLYFKLYDKSLTYLSKNATSKGKMIDYLINKGASLDLANKIVNELENRKLLDDRKYMQALCSHYIRAGYGKLYILNIAYKYKIEKSIANNALAEIDEEEFINSCICVGKKKVKTLNKYDEYNKKNKLIIYLQNRGFEYDVINQCLKEIL